MPTDDFFFYLIETLTSNFLIKVDVYYVERAAP